MSREAADADTDEEARLQADRLFPGHPLIEIWCGARQVMRIDRSGDGG